MSTTGGLMDRAFREFLTPPDEQPARFTLAAAITDTTATSFTVDTTLLSAEEENLFAPGTVVELGRELIQLGAYDENTNICSSCIRGLNNTTKATHLIGAQGLLAPKFSRQAVFDVVADEVELLYPDLSRVGETGSLTISDTTYTEIPAAVIKPMYVHARPNGSDSDSQWGEYTAIEFRDHFPPSSTGKAMYVSGLCGTATGYLVYRGRFTRPTDEDTDLVATCGLEDEWERIVLLGAVAYLVAGKDLSPIEQQFLSEQLANQGFPVGSAARVWSALRAFRQDLLEKAMKAQRGRERTTVTRRRVY